jgi:hypothetical protein
MHRLEHPDKVGNRMHLDLQKTAFGASFSAKRFHNFIPCGCPTRQIAYLVVVPGVI